jgi:rare lipoprotein A
VKNSSLIFNLMYKSLAALAASAVLSLGSAVQAAPFFALASWYGPGFHGRITANGEVYNQWGLTTAHKSLPFGTRVRVTNPRNGRSVVVRVNDRGPFIGPREFDLSRGAADAVGLTPSGVASLRFEIL